MDDRKRPRGRDTHVTQGGGDTHKRGEGQGTGPVGSSNGYGGHSSGKGDGQRPSGSGKGVTRAGGGIGLVAIVVLLLKLFAGGGSSSTGTSTTSSSSGGLGDILGTVLETVSDSASTATSGYGTTSSSSSSSGSYKTESTSYTSIDKTVASGSRNKYTSILGSGKDTATIMVYMCGTDLESKYGMASSDLGEMAAATYGDNVNVIVYTGGCSNWKTQGISNSTNQIYQVTGGKLKQLVKADGAKSMTDPETLSSFIKWAASNYPASRYNLIFWDHGGGSVSGYGYDEKFARKGSMELPAINNALVKGIKDGGIKFDFIGFDACLMATTETALMLNNYADYMIASEETEPGIGWYYTNWLTQYGSNTSTPTLDIAKTIIDDFVAQCDKQCRGQQTTLSVIDLAEFSNTVPSKLTAFCKSISSLIKDKEYKSVSDARYNTREFAKSSKIDQIDLIDLCNKVGNSEGKALSKALKGAIKYNKTSTSITNAYGVSIYFPYQKTSSVDHACTNSDTIGMDDSYAECIKDFAAVGTSGQIATGGSSSPTGSLFDLLGTLAGGALSTSTSSSSSSSTLGSDVVGQLLGSFLGSGGASTLIQGLTGSNINFLSGRALSTEETAEYIAANQFDRSNLFWKEKNGKYILSMPENQWDLIHAIDMNMFYDDGKGYIDMGLDNVYDWTDDGDMIARTDKTWLAVNGQTVAYYHEDTSENGDDYTITGRIPAKLNGEFVNLLVVFDNAHPDGYISGARKDYKKNETQTVAKSVLSIKDGDKIDFLCDYYDYNGKYQDNYYLGRQLTVSGPLTLSNVNVGKNEVRLMYRLTDIYNQEYWTENIKL